MLFRRSMFMSGRKLDPATYVASNVASNNGSGQATISLAGLGALAGDLMLVATVAATDNGGPQPTGFTLVHQYPAWTGSGVGVAGSSTISCRPITTAEISAGSVLLSGLSTTSGTEQLQWSIWRGASSAAVLNLTGPTTGNPVTISGAGVGAQCCGLISISQQAQNSGGNGNPSGFPTGWTSHGSGGTNSVGVVSLAEYPDYRTYGGSSVTWTWATPPGARLCSILELRA